MEYETQDDSSDVECPTCGEQFGGENGMKVHHARAHGESIAGVEVECSWCGETKTVKNTHAEKQDHFFCDARCQGDWRSEHNTGPDNPLWEGTVVECEWCGEEKEVPGWHYDRHEMFFCDMSCHGEWRSENRSGEDNHNWEGVVSECATCGRSLNRWRSQVDRNDNNFCSRECYADWLSENMVGEDHHLWEGGQFPYGAGWSEKTKERIRDRQDRECVDCGIHESELPERLNVHHIQKARSFDDAEERNDNSNLVALCRSCHLGKWEKMSPLRPQTPHLN